MGSPVSTLGQYQIEAEREKMRAAQAVTPMGWWRTMSAVLVANLCAAALIALIYGITHL